MIGNSKSLGYQKKLQIEEIKNDLLKMCLDFRNIL
jgi:hypothetical protein